MIFERIVRGMVANSLSSAIILSADLLAGVSNASFFHRPSMTIDAANGIEPRVVVCTRFSFLLCRSLRALTRLLLLSLTRDAFEAAASSASFFLIDNW